MLDYYIADVFTDQVFSGTQIGVFVHAEHLTTEQMSQIAAEMNLSETVFISNHNKEKYIRSMRVFSPIAEIEFASQPILAAAYVLGHSGDIELEEGVTTVRFIQNVGEIEVNITVQNGKPSFAQFSRKVPSIVDRYAPDDHELADLLMLSVNDIDTRRYRARLVSCGYPYLVVPVWKYESVRNARFNYIAWNQSAAPQTAAMEILLFSPKTPQRNSNFNVRLLGPNIGINDDPPVGNAMPAFASYLSSFESTQEGTHTFSVDMGDDKRRRSLLDIEMDYKNSSELTVRLGGHAVIVAEGKMFLNSVLSNERRA